MTLKQPALGIISTIICIILALAICAQFDVFTFNTWVSFIVIATIPPQIILALVWQCDYPNFLKSMKQPAKGILLLMLMTLAGLIAAYVSLIIVGGMVTPPTPMLIMFTILSVLITMWVVAVWQCWPLNAINNHPAFIGVGALLLTYVITYFLFTALFNFGFMSEAPFYSTDIDPSGKLNAWTALTFFLTTVAIIDALILLDFWPTSRLTEKLPALAKQPASGLSNTVLILILSYLIWNLFVTYLGMDVVDYMVKVVVSFIFGEFIMLVMMQTSPFTNMKQPYKGFCLLACCAILAIAMYWLYGALSVPLVGEMQAGAPNYDLDLWLASAMLSITFPLLIIVAEFFKFWPIKTK